MGSAKKAAKIGDRFGDIEIIGEAPPKISGGQPRTCWKILCHRCGKVKVTTWDSIQKSSTCGCASAANRKYSHICDRCGTDFLGGITARYCPSCKAEIDDLKGKKGGNARVKIPITCCDCGAVFYAGTKVAKRCPACRPAAHRKSNAESAQRAKNGDARKIGSEAVCPDCGNPFVLKNGFQKYCDGCAKNHPNYGWKSIKKYYGKG